MTIARVMKELEDLAKKGLYVSKESTAEALRLLKKQYSQDVSLERVREIAYRVLKKHKITLSGEVRYVTRG